MRSGAAALALVVVGLGGVVANLGLVPASRAPSAAAASCAGFPLCNGQLWSASNRYVLAHVLHRGAAFVLVIVVAWLLVATWRRRGAVRAAVGTAALLTLAQGSVGAAMVLLHLPSALRVLHMALGVAVWAALVAAASLPTAGAARERAVVAVRPA
jgi:heme A synthase